MLLEPGGGGAGATGYDGGAGTNGSGPPVGLQATTSALGAGFGGSGGRYGCIGGGGGGGGGGVARNGLTLVVLVMVFWWSWWWSWC